MYVRSTTRTLVFALLLAALVPAAAAQDLVGTWYARVEASEGGQPAFEALQTYHANGTLTETTNLLVHLAEGPGHGAWVETEDGYAATFHLFIFENGEHIGRVQVRSSIQMVGPDSLVAEAVVDLLLADGTFIPEVDRTPFAASRVKVTPVTSTSTRTEAEAPRAFTLHQNYPNPFNPSTTIPFEVHRPGEVHLAIYDLLGREVRTLVDREMPAGSYAEVWDGSNGAGSAVASGLYLARLRAGAQTSARKLMFVK